MQYPRPILFTAQRPTPVLLPAMKRVSALAGLGELGDATSGAGASGSVALFRSYLETYICAKAGPAYLQNARATPNLMGSINLAATAFLMGEAGTLQPAAQASWNQWRAIASQPSSNDNAAWIFGRMIASAKDDLVAAAARNGGWWQDPANSAATYTLVDTSTNGTTWYGGTTVASKLTNDQWATIFTFGFAALLKGVTRDVLPLTHLEVFCRGLLQQPTARRMPVFSAPPGNLPPTDPKAVAFRAAMKQLGWNDVINRWYGFTAQAWAADNAAFESQDASYASVITGLSYISGAKILEQIEAKLADYWQCRASAAQAINDFNTMASGPLGAKVSATDKANMATLTSQYQSIDQQAYATLGPAGLWSASSAGSLSGLGAIQLLIAGVLAVTALGVIAYVVALMTKVGRDAAAQTKATADSILATVSDVKDSCQRTYDASTKDAVAEQALQACLVQTKALTDSIPKPPDSSDPLGMKWIALVGAVGIAGLIAITAFKSRQKG
jgi:hypothetical protein